MENNTGTLYLVPTPIGNLDDITLRAIKTLQSVDLIGAEDTRTSAVLLSHFDIKTPAVSYHKFNERKRISHFLSSLAEGKDIAIITDAGTPGISDPAEILIRAAIEEGIKVCTLPGASAFLPALVSSGFSCRHFVFLGFLPTQKSERNQLLERISSYPETIIFYESGQKFYKFLETIREFLGNRKVSIGREISKLYETYYRDSLDTLLANRETLVLKGEFTVVVEGAIYTEVSDEDLIRCLQDFINEGDSVSSAASKASKHLKTGKNRAYKLALNISPPDLT